jgi:hypothetical protein
MATKQTMIVEAVEDHDVPMIDAATGATYMNRLVGKRADGSVIVGGETVEVHPYFVRAVGRGALREFTAAESAARILAAQTESAPAAPPAPEHE